MFYSLSAIPPFQNQTAKQAQITPTKKRASDYMQILFQSY